MRKVGALSLALAFSSASHAAAFYGTLTVDGRLPGPGRNMQIELVCRAFSQVVPIDERGAYRFINLPAASGCEVRVEGASAPVVLYSNPTRFDFALTHPPGGQPALRQR